MFQRILVPLDGSKRAERLVPVALRLARSNGGTIILLRVVNPNWPSFSKITSSQDLALNAKIEAEDYLVTLSKTPAFKGVHTEIVVPYGSEGATILTTSMQQRVDIIVLNAHGYTSESRWTMGNVADKVARCAEMPVLLFRDKSALPLGPHPDPVEPLRILVPLDGSPLALTALEPAAELIVALSTANNRALHLTSVIGDRAQLPEARDYLQSILDRIRQKELAPIIARKHVIVTWSVTINTDTADGIIRVAENGEDAENSGVFGGCDIIAMATHGLTGLPFWTLGSTTERVHAGTRLPLLIVRPAATGKPLTIPHQYEPVSLGSEN